MDFNYFLSVLGLVLVVEAIPYVAFPETFKKWLMQLSRFPDAHLRALGVVGIVTGIVLLYWARSRIG